MQACSKSFNWMGVEDGGREAKMPTLKMLSNLELWE
jgi:hypothetical protein